MGRRNESYVPLLCNYPDSEKINSVSEGAEAMFCRLLAKCDDEGNYYGSPARLLCKLYALRFENGSMTEKKVLRYRDELETAKLLTRYVSGKVAYLHINNIKKSLRKDIARKLGYPEFTEALTSKQDNESVTEPVRARNGHVTPIQTNPIQTKPIKDKYMDFVSLSKDEHSKLIERFGSISILKEKITALNDYLGSTGKKYASHYHTILTWARKDDKGALQKKKAELFPIKGRNCSHTGCNLPAVYEYTNDYGHTNYKCIKHMPESVRAKYG
ncbi:MAG TPA: hypothetical protein ENH82_10760 [bacterium]|nr:hypothetical protein [bacterium]